MKKLSQFLEDCNNLGPYTRTNPGNGVMNHYMPPSNIIIMIKNVFGMLLPIVVEQEKDYGIVISSSKFVTLEDVARVMEDHVGPGGGTGKLSLKDYIESCGLSLFVGKYGQDYKVYALPIDMNVQMLTTGELQPYCAKSNGGMKMTITNGPANTTKRLDINSGL